MFPAEMDSSNSVGVLPARKTQVQLVVFLKDINNYKHQVGHRNL